MVNYMVTKVQGIEGVDPRWVNDFEDPQMNGYPFIAVVPKQGTNKWLTNLENQLNHVITIRIYQEINKSNIGAKAGEELLRQLMDTIITSFNNDNKLGNTDVYTKPINYHRGWVPDRPILTYEVEVECIDILGATG